MIRVIQRDEMIGRCPICMSPVEDDHYENCQALVMAPMYSKINHPSYDLSQHYPKRRSTQ